MYEKLNSKKQLIAGIGSALVDILIYEDDSFLSGLGGARGGMTLVDHEFQEDILAQSSSEPVFVPGGSACNTIVGISQLGGQARFIGKRGDDIMGTLFESDLRNNGVHPLLFLSSTPTGRVLSVITPDAQRSMFTFLGASEETAFDEITPSCFDNAAIVHVEGYLLFNKDLILHVLKTAREAGVVISLDLASFTVVEQSKKYLEKLVKKYVDILIANEDEARVFTGHDDEIDALKAMAKKADIAVLKVGKRGSYIACEGNITRIEAEGSTDIVDTTGAGDLWAAGFLYGLVNGYPIESCGKIASACGYEVCRVVGANIPNGGWKRIKNYLQD